MSSTNGPVAELVDDSVRLVGPLARLRDITVAVEGCNELPALGADRKRLLQVMLNLLSNAVKYNVDGGDVTVACAATGGSRVQISVTDTGPGISDEEMAKLFVPFERLGAERTEIEGTGIGLVLSKALVERMGGQIDVTSTPGQGSTFSLTFPEFIDRGAADAPS
jgi:signal transduction histidine kinase